MQVRFKMIASVITGFMLLLAGCGEKKSAPRTSTPPAPKEDNAVVETQDQSDEELEALKDRLYQMELEKKELEWKTSQQTQLGTQTGVFNGTIQLSESDGVYESASGLEDPLQITFRDNTSGLIRVISVGTLPSGVKRSSLGLSGLQIYTDQDGGISSDFKFTLMARYIPMCQDYVTQGKYPAGTDCLGSTPLAMDQELLITVRVGDEKSEVDRDEECNKAITTVGVGAVIDIFNSTYGSGGSKTATKTNADGSTTTVTESNAIKFGNDATIKGAEGLGNCF